MFNREISHHTFLAYEADNFEVTNRATASFLWHRRDEKLPCADRQFCTDGSLYMASVANYHRRIKRTLHLARLRSRIVVDRPGPCMITQSTRQSNLVDNALRRVSMYLCLNTAASQLEIYINSVATHASMQVIGKL